MFIGIGIGTGFLSGTGTGAIALTMSGLTDGEARPGNHGSISVAAPDGVTFVSQAWSVGATSYGTGSNPDDYTADDGGTLRWEATGDDSLTYRAFALIRRAVAVNTAAPVIQSTGTGLGDTITMTPGTWMGDAGGAFTERLFRDGEPLVVGSPTVSYEIDIADSEAVITGTREYTNSGGTTSVSVTGSVTVDDLVAVPDEFGDEDWEFVNGDDASTLEINILALPFDNGSEITDIEYRVDGGSAVSLGTTETGAYVLPGTVVGTEYDAEIRAVNGEGAGPVVIGEVGDPGRSARRLRSGRLDADRPCLRRRRARCDIRTPWQQRRGADAARLPDRRRNVAASHGVTFGRQLRPSRRVHGWC
jgi:hypothetical protein